MREPNLCIDMIRDGLRHYKKISRPVKEVQLSHNFWLYFLLFVGENHPEMYDAAKLTGQMDFRGFSIKKGSKFMTERLVFELKPLVAEA